MSLATLRRAKQSSAPAAADRYYWANAYADFAEVLSRAGRPDDAADILRGALDRYQRKRVVVMVERTRERLQALQEEVAPSWPEMGREDHARVRAIRRRASFVPAGG